MAFNNLYVSPARRISSAWGNAIVNILNELYNLQQYDVTFEDLLALYSSIVPAQDNQFSLGAQGNAWQSMYGYTGFFNDNLYVNGKVVLKDGDPINLYEIFTPAQQEIASSVQSALGIFDIDEYGNLGVNVQNGVSFYALSPEAQYQFTKAVLDAPQEANLGVEGNINGQMSLYDIYEPAQSQLTQVIVNALQQAQISSETETTIEQFSPTAQQQLYDIISNSLPPIQMTYYGDVIVSPTGQVQVYDITPNAQSEIASAVENALSDKYGDIGVVITDPLDAYGRVRVSIDQDFTPVSAEGSVLAPYNSNGLAIMLQTNGRPNVNVYYSVSGSATIYIQGSNDGVSWKTIYTLSPGGAESNVKVYQGIAYKYIQVATPTTGINVEFEISASR